MAYNSSLTAFPDIIEILDRALASPKGIRVSFDTKKDAITFCGRVHSFRSLDRKANAKIYDEDDPMHGKSAFDPLMIQKESELVVKIVKLDSVEFNVEELT